MLTPGEVQQLDAGLLPEIDQGVVTLECVQQQKAVSPNLLDIQRPFRFALGQPELFDPTSIAAVPVDGDEDCKPLRMGRRQRIECRT